MLLIIDNYDSFTWNLVHYLEALGPETKVVRNDAWSVAEVLAFAPEGIVLSPGPCTPNEAGICLELVTAAPATLPILGVCLGHQAIGQVHGGQVLPARTVMHGKLSPVRHEGGGVFADLPSPFLATRYHSLGVRLDPGSPLVADAWTEDGEIMGFHHRERPVFGVQFHPEAIATEHGHALLKNFLKATTAP
jgi:anthranilate synthase component 2